jgi:hypothetical protein
MGRSVSLVRRRKKKGERKKKEKEKRKRKKEKRRGRGSLRGSMTRRAARALQIALGAMARAVD